MYNIENRREAIKEVQRLLEINMTGDFDTRTSEAVKQHQSERNLEATGVVDYNTFLSLVESFRIRPRLSEDAKAILFSPSFPYSLGSQDDNVGRINSMLRDILSEYTVETKLPYGNYYNRDTVDAVLLLRKIFMMNTSTEIDEILFNRMVEERNSIQTKKYAE